MHYIYMWSCHAADKIYTTQFMCRY